MWLRDMTFLGGGIELDSMVIKACVCRVGIRLKFDLKLKLTVVTIVCSHTITEALSVTH